MRSKQRNDLAECPGNLVGDPARGEKAFESATM
jgi:hypothetical protein